MSRVIDIIDEKLVSVSPDATAIEAAQQMRACGAGVIPVCENGKFRGIVRERDIMGLVAAGIDPACERVGTVMCNHLPIVPPGADIVEAAKIMVNNGVRELPVAQNGRLVSLLTLDVLARKSPALAALVFSKTANSKRID